MTTSDQPFRLTATFASRLVGDLERNLQPLFAQGFIMKQFSVTKTRQRRFKLTITYGHKTSPERSTVTFHIHDYPYEDEIILNIHRIKDFANQKSLLLRVPDAQAGQLWAARTVIETTMDYFCQEFGLTIPKLKKVSHHDLYQTL